MRLTDAKVKKLEAVKDKVWFDDELSCFGLRVRPSGVKAFVLYYKFSGKNCKITLGRPEFMSVREARELARKLKKRAMMGVNPIDARRGDEKDGKFKDFLEIYLDKHCHRYNKSSKEAERRIRNKIIPSLGDIDLAQISRNDIDTFHYELTKTAPYEANRCLELISHAISLSMVWGFRDCNPASTIKPNKEKKRDRYFSSDEFRLIWSACSQEDNFYMGKAIQMLMITGLRKQEVLKMKWADYYVDNKEMKIVQKGDKKRWFPLSEKAIELLGSIPPTHGNAYIFCGRDKEGLKDLKSGWTRIRKVTGIENARLHDLRRTVASMLIQSGVSIDWIQEFLDHSDLRVTQIYARLNQETTHKVNDAWNEQLNSLTLE